jgi:hypothetical protein
MADSADFVVRYNDFSGGDYGILDPARAKRNQYSGINVIEYNSGLLGVRPGFKTVPVAWPGTSNLDGDISTVPGPLGFDVWGEELVLQLNSRSYGIPISEDPIVPHVLGVYSSPPTEFVRYAQGGTSLYSTVDGVLYKHTAGGSTATVVSTPFPIRSLVRWNYNLVAVDIDNPSRIWYSTVDVNGPNFDSWGANNYLDVGSTVGINTLRPLFNTLYAGKTDGWWGVSGILGSLAYVRFRVMGNGPIDERQVTTTTDNRILYWPNEPVPAWFGGEGVALDKNQQIVGFKRVFAADTVVSTPTGQRLVMLGERQDAAGDPIESGMLVHQNDAWSSHVLANSFSALVPQDVRAGGQLPDGTIFAVKTPTTVGETVEIQSFSHGLHRPGHASDKWAGPTDSGETQLVTGNINLSAFYDPQGRSLLVRSVIVQFKKWASGTALTKNRLEVQVIPLGVYDGGTLESEIQVWEEDSDRSAVTGTDDSFRFEVGAQGWANGYQIRFPQLRGVAIREVVVTIEARTKRV